MISERFVKRTTLLELSFLYTAKVKSTFSAILRQTYANKSRWNSISRLTIFLSRNSKSPVASMCLDIALPFCFPFLMAKQSVIFFHPSRVLLTGYTDGSGSIFGVKRKRSVQFALPRKRYEADYIDEDDDVLGEYEEDDDDDADTDTEDDNEDEEDDEGDEDVNDEDDEVKVNDDDDDDDEDDEDYVPPDEEDSLFASRFRFCDPFDRRFMSGIELRHFGLQSHENAEDEINLRDDEMDAIEKETK
ncbi:hypothetical protein BX666DRAFT_1267863 [Dichotomocladium elegans]|nr:hypothetical protein BX666DRAFT_1267863 [Dichotomocladium elegans]